MLNVTLREHQVEAIAAVSEKYYSGVTTQLVNLPTGTGKTILAHAIGHELNMNRTLFLVHREELANQTVNSYKYVLPNKTVSNIRDEVDSNLVVGMIQTVYNRTSSIDPNRFDMVVLDEAHHSAARTWNTVATYFNSKLRLGLSATPERMDGAPLIDLFDTISYSLSLKDAIGKGYLCKILYYRVPTNTYLGDISIRAGDYSLGELADAIDSEARNSLIAYKLNEHANNRKTIVFCANIEHSENLAKVIRDNTSLRCEAVHSQCENRSEIIDKFKNGELDVLTNPMILTEGFDEPSVDCIVLARPTKSRPLYIQQIGRGLRLYDNKEDCLILDLFDLYTNHQVNPSSFNLGEKKAQDIPVNIDDVLSDPSNILNEDNICVSPTAATPEENYKLRKKIRWDDEASLDILINVLDRPPPQEKVQFNTFRWDVTPATDKQLAVLSSNGYDVCNCYYSKMQASILISKIMDSPASESQLRLVFALGGDILKHKWLKSEASVYINSQKDLGIKPNWKMVDTYFDAIIKVIYSTK